MEENAWEKLGRPIYVVAPMVDASELAWRMLCRKHGAQLCYTPMIHSSCFVKSTKYREQFFITCPQDRPLIVQFSGNNSETLLKAALLVEPYCDCIDINLGCPQPIAKRGCYGAYLQDNWELLTQIVRTLRSHLKIPVSCKIRIFNDTEKSVRYAQMLESAGCQLLTVHGRTREQRGPLTGVASWEHIKMIKNSVKIPVIANGNIQCLADVHRCLIATSCDGVMSAEGILCNPALFEDTVFPVWEMALEYLDLLTVYPCPISYVRGHLFKLLHHVLVLPENENLRESIGKSKNYDQFREIVLLIKDQYEPVHTGKLLPEISNSCVDIDYNLKLPPWLCQPYVRLSPEEHLKKLMQLEERNSTFDVIGNDENEKSNKRLLDGYCNNQVETTKKIRNTEQADFKKLPPLKEKRIFQKCLHCLNPVGLKCEYKLCKTCCRKKCNEEQLSCPSHRVKKKVPSEGA